jgi:hypothetical protein
MSTKHKLEFVYQMAKYSTASIRDCERLMRYGATWIRLDTEFTNGYKFPEKHPRAGEWDETTHNQSKKKMARIAKRMETLAKDAGCSIEYGALTVRVKFSNGREAGLP